MPRSVDRYISMRALKSIQQICTPLNKLGIIEFTHDISFPNGKISILSTNPKVFKHWYRHSMPTIRTDENGRTLDEGIYLSSLLEENYSECAEITPVFNALCNANQHVSIVQKENDCQHLFTFSFRQNKEFIHWLINNVTQLQSFVEYYKHSANKIILEAKNPINHITIPLLKNNPADDAIHDINAQQFSQKLIHKDTKIPVFISRQQSICLALLMKGKTAKEMGLEMGLSYRTIQHYLERIKKLLGCSTIKELIIFYSNQIVPEE